MKTNIKIVALLALSLFNWGDVWAKDGFYQGKLDVQKNVLRAKNDTIEIDLRFNLDSIIVRSKSTLTIVPVLKNDTNEYFLSEIWVNGNNRQKVYERRQELGKNMNTYKNAYMVVDQKDTLKHIDYLAKVPYEPWMRNAHLYIQEDKCGCADSRLLMNENDLGKILFRPDSAYQPRPVVTFITPQAEAVKNRNEIGEAFLDFVVGRYDIKPDFRRNPIELEKVNKLISGVFNDKNLVINGIVFTGKASPEASFQFNKKLSENRAKALLDYVNARYKLNPEWLRAQSLGEDWLAFERIVEVSGMEYRDDVLAIIRSDEDPDVKEKQLKALHGGKVYKYLDAEVFPQLRRVECRVDFTVRAFSVQEGKEIIKTRPRQLSLNEMFLVANTYESGSPEFNEVFDIAVRMYPDDEVANFNAAATALSKGNIEKARLHMEKCSVTPERYNNIGVLYLLEGDLEKAEHFLTDAKNNDVKEADYNLRELETKRADNDLFESFR